MGLFFIKGRTAFSDISEGQWVWKTRDFCPILGKYPIMRRLVRKKPFEGGAGTVPRGTTQEESEA